MPTSHLSRIVAVAAFAASAWLAGPSPRASADEATTSPALKSVQGVWTSRDDAEVAAKWTIKGDVFKATVNGVEYLGKVSVDDAAKPHPSFTIDVTDGPGEVKGKTAKGVYKIEGDQLIVNLSVPGGDRPTGFDPNGQDVYLFELTKKSAQ
ncbi:TIGR03067 domain-containing protein [Paludisphaera soli]|uniref:TIGR03067 domain-containing protein n=1 Tax=Paludisphaera soli TaxID=2712865 RepID=UPI0013ED81B9|nr:TIGR03067 domain-containing protein [Paludisphaera soli]